MVKKIKSKKIASLGKFIFVIATIFVGLLVVVFGHAKAAVFDCDAYLKTNSTSSTDCDQLTGDQKDKCESADKKIKDYCDLYELKSKTTVTLKNQLSLIDTQQAINQTELIKARSKAESLDQQINDLIREIKDKESLLKYQQSVLASLMQAYYEYNQEGFLNIILINQNFSEIFNQSDHIAQSSSHVNDVLKTIQDAKIELQNEYDTLAQKKQESEQAKSDLENKNLALKNTEMQKQSLLSQTQGEEQKYQKLLARMEQQKMELFDFSSASNIGEVSASVDSYPKPDSKYWATSWYFSQKDSRWGDQTIGNSKTLMSGYGCAVTSLAMVLRSYGANVDPGKMAKQSIFSYDLIKWPGSWNPGITLASSIGHSGVNWTTVDSEIAKGDKVIVYIRKTNGKGGHYVVIHNKDKKDYVVNDPYFGANLYLGTSRALVGKIGVDSNTVVDQMIIYKK
jgi:peptidoglycan hydrolase CwlO-like protein